MMTRARRSQPPLSSPLYTQLRTQLHAHLREGLSLLPQVPPFSDAQEHKLLAYLDLLVKWNSAYNLTAIREPVHMVTHHVLDSLAILPFLKGPQVLDMGSGAGLPGIPLAIARPDWHMTLLDSNGKKTRFLQHVKAQLGLQEVTVCQARIEDYQREAGFDTIVCRAFASIERVLTLMPASLKCNSGQLVVMAGQDPRADEMAARLPEAARIETLRVPGIKASRHLVIVPLT